MGPRPGAPRVYSPGLPGLYAKTLVLATKWRKMQNRKKKKEKKGKMQKCEKEKRWEEREHINMKTETFI